jgi:leucyl-tRNA synthetase
MEKYDHHDIEKKWQKTWQNEGLYNVKNHEEGKENYYTLTEFSYPSGNLHVGHWYAYSATDIFARYKRMQGYNVLFPTGFDSFGLPAENAAIKRGLDPRKWTYENMEYMKDQLASMGTMFDWSRTLATSDPDYYKWTQWMFAEFFKNDLAYRATTQVNWCPSCKTVLANEQVHDGHCERCDSEIEKKDQDQWMLRITKYADQLHDDLEDLDWPEEIKAAQRAWIGRSEGSELSFQLNLTSNPSPLQGAGSNHEFLPLDKGEVPKAEGVIKVFTTRPDTLFGVTYVVLAPEHPLLETMMDSIENKEEVLGYIQSTQKKSERERQQDKEKTGVQLQGITAVNPINGEEVPVWIADYVLAGYGTGAVMAVPAHDERDFEFAESFNLPIKQVVTDVHHSFKYYLPNISNAEYLEFLTNKISSSKYFYDRETQELFSNDLGIFGKIKNSSSFAESKERSNTEVSLPYVDKGFLINSGDFLGLTSEEAKQKITEKAGGEMKKTYRIRDWGMSRQRYWGCPIPIVYDPQGKAHPVPLEHLPWILPDDVDHTPDGTSPLARSEELKTRTEEIFGAGWTPEVETMDTFVDSSWYFYRYLDVNNDTEFCSKEAMKKWMPVDLYMGGAEHTTMHVLYSRFFNKALFDLGYVTESEPYKVRRNRGLILGPDGNKMSKSKGNVIDPDEQVKFVGADTVRMYLGFMGPYGTTANYPWDPNGVVGIRRFLERVWRLGQDLKETDSLESLLHETIRDVTNDMEKYKFNTAISKLMILTNQAEKDGIARATYETVLCMLAVLAPHISEEIWRGALGHTSSVHLESWPVYDMSRINNDTVQLPVQVNGKLRVTLEIPTEIEKEILEARVLENEIIKKWVEDKQIKKIIYVPGKIFNIVV